ncbi:3005_t:CDS:2 [Gigaspora margarita]|uniref:3005_t:CDS:1 n=1 Tax=Gigaspora margarita TaxID=4874 RepID=A0ABN7UZP2_GIGMA|nr:3005_t:CDS:2 [Gigaspora margarita]
MSWVGSSDVSNLTLNPFSFACDGCVDLPVDLGANFYFGFAGIVTNITSNVVRIANFWDGYSLLVICHAIPGSLKRAIVYGFL